MMADKFIPHPACTVFSGDCFVAGQCLGQCKSDLPMTDTYTPVLTDAQILAIGAFGQSPLKRLDHARAVERAVVGAYQRQHAAESLLLGRILSTWHNTGETGDVDGAWLQDAVIAAGLATQGDDGYTLTPRAMELIGLAAGERS